MPLSITHQKVDTLEDFTQAKLNELISLGQYPEGTALADIVLPSDWNDTHTITGGDELNAALYGAVIVDTGSDNYTLTATEASSGFLVITNTGVSKTITIPATSFDYVPSNISLFVFSDNDISIKLEGYAGSTTTLRAYIATGLAIDTDTGTIVNMVEGAGSYSRVYATDAIKLTSQALESTPLAGYIEYLTNVMYFTPTASNRAVSEASHIACLSSAVSLADDTSVQDAFGSTYGEFNCDANTTYLVEGAIYLTTGTTSHRIDMGFSGTATFDSLSIYVDTYPGPYGAGGKTNVNGAIGATGITAVSFASTLAGEYKKFSGVMRISTAGTIKTQIQFSAAPGGTNQVEPNSFIKFTPIGTNSMNSVGNFS